MQTSTAHKRIVVISIAVALLGALSWIILFLQTPQPLFSSSRNRILLFILLNIHTIAVMGLLALILRQSIKLISDRKQKTAGSIFTRNLLFAFMVFSVLPTFAVFFMAGKLITKSIDHWFRAHIKSGLESGIALHQHHYQKLYADMDQFGKKISTQLENNATWKSLSAEKKAASLLLFAARTPHHFPYHCYLYHHLSKSFYPTTEREEHSWTRRTDGLSAPASTLSRHFKMLCMRNGLLTQSFHHQGVLYWSKRLALADAPGWYCVISYHYPQPISNSIATVEQALFDFDHLKRMRREIYLNYLSSLIVGTLIILFLAIWCAFYLARGIARPIHELLLGMERVQKGEKDVVVAADHKSDLDALALGFNTMTQQLQLVHEKLEYRNAQLSTILEHIKEAVFFINKFGRIIMYNVAAAEMVENYLHLNRFVHKKSSLFGVPIVKLFSPLIRSLYDSGKKELSQEISFLHDHEERTFLVHLVSIKSSAEGDGLLILIEDLSTIVHMKKIQTWQEAAKQIAHEIKNPLTPIQLATQRLQRKYSAQLSHEQAFLESTETILQQVKVIKDLVSHFSQFAQMPETVRESVDINTLIAKVLPLYKLSYPEVSFVCNLEEYLPSITVDGRKIKRALINLLDNSVRALQEHQISPAQITITTNFKQSMKLVEVVIADNGPGLPEAIKQTLFVPHISTNTTHMGLGLAIVHEIVTQSGGNIRLLPQTQGTTFLLRFSA